MAKNQEISFDDHYQGSDFDYWGRALKQIATYFEENINLEWGWREVFEEGKSPIEAFREEYPEYF